MSRCLLVPLVHDFLPTRVVRVCVSPAHGSHSANRGVTWDDPCLCRPLPQALNPAGRAVSHPLPHSRTRRRDRCRTVYIRSQKAQVEMTCLKALSGVGGDVGTRDSHRGCRAGRWERHGHARAGSGCRRVHVPAHAAPRTLQLSSVWLVPSAQCLGPVITQPPLDTPCVFPAAKRRSRCILSLLCLAPTLGSVGRER